MTIDTTQIRWKSGRTNACLVTSHPAEQPVSLSENKDALVLRLKYHKTTLFLTCQPTTTITSLKSDFLTAVRATYQPELSTLPQYTQPDGKAYPSWGELHPEEDIGLFIASSTDADESMTVFMPLDQDTARSDMTVRKAGLKDADIVCVGFRAQGSRKCIFIHDALLILAPADSLLVFSLFLWCFTHPQRRSLNRSCSSRMPKRRKKMLSIPTRSHLRSPTSHMYTISARCDIFHLYFTNQPSDPIASA